MAFFSHPICTYHAIDSATGAVALTGIRMTETWPEAAVGLIGTRGQERQPLLLRDVRAIHTAGVRFDLDLAFFDAAGVCLQTLFGLKPWRIAIGPRGTTKILEVRSRQPSQLRQIAPRGRFVFEPATKS